MFMIVITVAIIASVILLDQVSKALIVAFLYRDQVDLIEGVLRFTYVENKGMAFGLLADHRWVFLILSVIGIGLIGFYLFRFVRRTLSRVGLALIVGGGIGNMIDRIAYGYVIDFIDFCAFDFWVWVFNVADAAVCVGAAIFVLDLILETVADVKKKRAAASVGEDNDKGEGSDA